MKQQTKQTEIPSGWEKIELGNKISLEYGKGLPERQRKKGNVEVYGSNGVVGHHNEAIVEGPGIVVGRKGTIGAVSYTDEDFYPIDTTYFVKLKDKKINWRWLFYKLFSMKLNKLNTATGTPGLNRDLAYSQEIIMPLDNKEQTAIAKILSTVNENLEILERERRATERLRRGVMVKLLENTKWKVESLSNKNYFELIMGQSPPSSSYNYVNQGLPFLQGNAEFGDIYPKAIKYTSKPLKIAKPNDILISVRAPVGEINLCNKETCIGRGLGAIRILQGEHMFYYHFLNYIKNSIKNMGQGSTFKAVTINEMKKIMLPIPSLPEQRKIAEILNTIDEKLNLQKQRKGKLERIKKGLMDELLTGKKRVNIEKVLEVRKNG